jgi:hypothetical protein
MTRRCLIYNLSLQKSFMFLTSQNENIDKVIRAWQCGQLKW